MQLSAKARLISVIVAVVFMAGALIGSGVYLIVNHINKANATRETTLSISGNLYNTDGSLNANAVSQFVDKLDFVTSGGTYTSPKIADNAKVTATNSFIFQMGYYVSPSGVMDTSKPITWQAVYARNGYLTIWMTKNYTVSDYNDYNANVSTSSPFSDYSGNAPYSEHSNYSKSVLRDVTNNIYDLIAAKLNNFSTIVRSPNEANATWQATQTEDVYTWGSSYYDHHNGLKSYSGKYTGWAQNLWDSTNPPYNDKFWIPSSVEVFNQSATNGVQVNNGLWGLTATDRAFSTVRLDTNTSTSSSSSGYSNYCWLRSGLSDFNYYAVRVGSTGSARFDYVYYSYGVRPAAHLSLSALEDLLPSYTITTNYTPANSGTVSGGGTYKQGTSITLRATANSGYRFVRWERNGTQVSTSASYTFTVSGSYTYTAIFEPATATISTAVSPTGTGTATGGGTYTMNTTATLTATPITGYKFVQWERYGSQVSTSTTYRPTVIGNTTYTAVFTPCTVSVSSNNNTWGTATYSRSQSGGIYSDQVTLTATANDGYRLDYWLMNGVRNDTAGTVYTFTITQDITAVAYFKRSNAFASATLGGEVRISGNDLGTGTTSTTVSYEAIPYTGYYLIGWYVGDMLYTENGTTYTGTTLTLPRATAEGVVVVPVFSTNTTGTPSLSFDLDNNTAITASIGGEARIIGDTYSITDTVTLIAAVQMQGYRFVGWYIDGIQVSTDETTILSRATVLGKIVQARFAPIDDSTTNDDTDNTQTDDFVFF